MAELSTAHTHCDCGFVVDFWCEVCECEVVVECGGFWMFCEDLRDVVSGNGGGERD